MDAETYAAGSSLGGKEKRKDVPNSISWVSVKTSRPVVDLGN
jgi:hypothetical protein